MCEIDVSPILTEDCSVLSASRAELGENAGRITWDNCIALAKRLPLVTDGNRDAAREHFASYGAWDRAEIEGWSDTELSAMIWQEAAASYREFEDYCEGDYDKYEAACESGSISGRLFLDRNGKTANLYLGM